MYTFGDEDVNEAYARLLISMGIQAAQHKCSLFSRMFKNIIGM